MIILSGFRPGPYTVTESCSSVVLVALVYEHNIIKIQSLNIMYIIVYE